LKLSLPILAHLHTYGSLAYVRNPKLAKGDKLESRSIKGYLIGYDTSKIFRIWIPTTPQISFGKVIRPCDVCFNKKLCYNPNDVQEPISLIKMMDILLANTPLGYIKYDIDAVHLTKQLHKNLLIEDISTEDILVSLMIPE
jgi:hypothetical protein